MNLKDFVTTVTRHWVTFVAVAAAVLVVGSIAIVSTPAQYISSTQLLVSIDGSTTADAYQNDDVVAGRVNSYIGLLTSDVVAQRVVDELGLPVSASDLAARISATNVPPRTSIIDVAVTDRSPTGAQRIARTLAAEFIGYTDALETPTGEDRQKVHTRVVTNATEPHEREAERIVLALLTVAAAVVLASVAVWIRSRIDPILRSADQAAAAGLTVIGTLTKDPRADTDGLEQYRRLQKRLRSLAGSQPDADHGQVIVLASAADEYDIRTVASELARAFEVIGGRSLVLDACSSPPDGSGPKTVSLSEWAATPDQLAAKATAEFFDGLRNDYDHVLVAAPPVLSSVTAAILGNHADAVVLVGYPGRTRRRDAARASDDLRATGTPLTGVILWQRSTKHLDPSGPESKKPRFTLQRAGVTGSIGVFLGVGAVGVWQILERLQSAL
ncbi:MAG: Wzz/FepE/Etk N-terminal domain-containing protein [Mycobacterium sp.]